MNVSKPWMFDFQLKVLVWCKYVVHAIGGYIRPTPVLGKSCHSSVQADDKNGENNENTPFLGPENHKKSYTFCSMRNAIRIIPAMLCPMRTVIALPPYDMPWPQIECL